MSVIAHITKENPGRGLDRARGKFNFDYWWRQSHAKNSNFQMGAQAAESSAPSTATAIWSLPQPHFRSLQTP